MATNPLDAFVSSKQPGTIKLPPVPRLVLDTDLKSSMERFNEQLQEWSNQLERLVNERFQEKEKVQAPPGTIE